MDIEHNSITSIIALLFLAKVDIIPYNSEVANYCRAEPMILHHDKCGEKSGGSQYRRDV